MIVVASFLASTFGIGGAPVVGAQPTPGDGDGFFAYFEVDGAPMGPAIALVPGSDVTIGITAYEVTAPDPAAALAGASINVVLEVDCGALESVFEGQAPTDTWCNNADGDRIVRSGSDSTGSNGFVDFTLTAEDLEPLFPVEDVPFTLVHVMAVYLLDSEPNKVSHYSTPANALASQGNATADGLDQPNEQYPFQPVLIANPMAPAGDGFVAFIDAPPVLEVAETPIDLQLFEIDTAGAVTAATGDFRLSIQIDCGALHDTLASDPPALNCAGDTSPGDDSNSKTYHFTDDGDGQHTVDVPASDLQDLLGANDLPFSAVHIWVTDDEGRQSNLALPTQGVLTAALTAAPDADPAIGAVDLVDGQFWHPFPLVDADRSDGFVAKIDLPDPTSNQFFVGQDADFHVTVYDEAEEFGPVSDSTYTLVLQIDCGSLQPFLTPTFECAGGTDTDSTTKRYNFEAGGAPGTTVTVPSGDLQELVDANGGSLTTLHIWVSESSPYKQSNFALPTRALLEADSALARDVVDMFDADLWHPVLLFGAVAPDTVANVEFKAGAPAELGSDDADEFPIEVTASMPVRITAHDDTGEPVDIVPGGLITPLPFEHLYYGPLTAGTDPLSAFEVTAQYSSTGKSSGTHSITVVAEDPSGTQILSQDTVDFAVAVPPTGSITGFPNDANDDGTIAASEMDTMLTGDATFDVDWEASDDHSGVASVSIEMQTPYDAADEWNVVETVNDATSGSTTILPVADGVHSFRVHVTDAEGTEFTSAASSIEVEPPPGQIVTLVGTTLEPADPFVRVGSFVVLNVHTNNDGFPTPTPAKNIKVELYEGEGVNPIATLLTNANGDASFSVRKTAAEDVTYEAHAVSQLTSDGFRDVESDPVNADVIWSQLLAGVPSFVDATDVASRNDSLSFQIPYTWDHDDSAATGLLAENGTTLGFRLAGTGLGAADPLVPDTATSIFSIAADSESGTTPGTYLGSYAHDLHETLTVASGGTANSYVNPAVPGDIATTFPIPMSSTVKGVWAGIFVDGPLALSNLDVETDPTPQFVNGADTVRITGTASYTANFDPTGDGNDGNDPAAGATVNLFKTSHLVSGTPTPVDPANNDDSVLQATTAADGGFAFDTTKADLLDGDNTYGLTVMPVAAAPAGGSIAQNITDTEDEADYSADTEVTFTRILIEYVEDSLLGSEDPAEADIATVTETDQNPWWFAPDADAATSLDDAATLRVASNFTHNAAEPASAAQVGVYFDGVELQTSLADANGIAEFTIDPDDHDLDYVLANLEFLVVSAPEPTPLTGEITENTDSNFAHGFLWTKIHLDVGEPTDAELPLGADARIPVNLYYYHDVDGDGDYYANGEILDPDDRVEAGGMVIDLEDTSPDPDVTTADASGIVGNDDTGLIINMARGCTDPTDSTSCLNSIDFDEAGWHTFTPSTTSDTPHDVPVDDPGNAGSASVLWTAVVLDATTDRLTAPAGTDIAATVGAYFAHDYDLSGEMTLAGRTFDRDVKVDLVDSTGFAIDASDPLGDDSSTYTSLTADITIPAGATAEVSISEANAGIRSFFFRSDEQVEGGDVDDPHDPSDPFDEALRQVARTPEFTRAWLTLEMSGAFDETTDDLTGDGDTDDTGLYTDNILALRGEDVDVALRLAVDDGSGPVNVNHTFGGYAFTSTETPVVSNMPDHTEWTAPAAFGTQDVLSLAGAEVNNAPTSLVQADFTYDDVGCDCWTATIAGAEHPELDEDVVFSLAAQLDVTDETMLADTEGNEFQATYTAIILQFLNAATSDGEGEIPTAAGKDLWVNFGETGTYRLKAYWAHDSGNDGSSFIGDGSGPMIIDTNDVATGVTIEDVGAVFTATESTPGTYTFDLGSATPALLELEFLATAADDPTTSLSAQDFSGPTLTWQTIELDAYFTQVDFNYLDEPDSFANLNEGVHVEFEALWAHDNQPIMGEEVSTTWDFPALGQRQATDDDGTGSIWLVGTEIGTKEVDPTYVTDDDTFKPHGITVSSVPEPNPTITWTQLVPTLPTPTGESNAADGVTDPDGDPDDDVFPQNELVTQSLILTFAHDDSIVPEGSDASLAGVPGTTDASGTMSIVFTSSSEAWYELIGLGESATIGGKQITSTQEASNWVGFADDGDPSS